VPDGRFKKYEIRPQIATGGTRVTKSALRFIARAIAVYHVLRLLAPVNLGDRTASAPSTGLRKTSRKKL
jgi:hypothetical protein